MAYAQAGDMAREVWTLADHPALGILNTVVQLEGRKIDTLQSDADVARWLEQFGWPLQKTASAYANGALLRCMRTLRETIRSAVSHRKAGRRVEATTLNQYLGKARHYMELTSKRDGSLQMSQIWMQRTPEEALAPLAEAAAELLAAGDFDLVRKCENDECVLWFYDRTRSHHRRWCSMATCGNRHKIAAFRRRRAEATQAER